jgi:hypothetical protein
MSPRDLRPKAEPVPAGWLTVRQWARKWDLSPAHTNALLGNGVRAKKVRRRSFRVVSGSRLLPVPHYRAA